MCCNTGDIAEAISYKDTHALSNKISVSQSALPDIKAETRSQRYLRSIMPISQISDQSINMIPSFKTGTKEASPILKLKKHSSLIYIHRMWLLKVN